MAILALKYGQDGSTKTLIYHFFQGYGSPKVMTIGSTPDDGDEMVEGFPKHMDKQFNSYT